VHRLRKARTRAYRGRNRAGSAPRPQQWFELLRPGRRGPAAGQRGQLAGPTAGPSDGSTASMADGTRLVIDESNDDLSERIGAELHAFNIERTGQQDLRPLSVGAWDGDDLLAGLSGWTWGGCGGIELIWVRPGSRRQGIGILLLEAAEKEIRRRGCDQVALSTYSFQAPGFYVRAGYIECGRRSDFPHGHDQILLTKTLS
jgi:GNAT superfamily N-acetyltransferase